MQATITGKPRGWYAYKEIEQLDFPRFTTAEAEPQEASISQQKIEKTGRFQLEVLEGNLRLHAYRRPEGNASL